MYMEKVTEVNSQVSREAQYNPNGGVSVLIEKYLTDVKK